MSSDPVSVNPKFSGFGLSYSVKHSTILSTSLIMLAYLHEHLLWHFQNLLILILLLLIVWIIWWSLLIIILIVVGIRLVVVTCADWGCTVIIIIGIRPASVIRKCLIALGTPTSSISLTGHWKCRIHITRQKKWKHIL